MGILASHDRILLGLNVDRCGWKKPIRWAKKNLSAKDRTKVNKQHHQLVCFVGVNIRRHFNVAFL